MPVPSTSVPDPAPGSAPADTDTETLSARATGSKAEPTIRQYLADSARAMTALADLAPLIAQAAEMMGTTLQAGGTVLFCGNGGSAADAQHLAAELEGRYLLDRAPLAGLALTVNPSSLTAIGNDYGFDQVFARQVLAHGRPNDVLVSLSTSGNSPNVLAAIQAARARSIAVIGLTGASGGAMRDLCDLCLSVPATHTPIIQQCHISVGHVLCGLIEHRLGV